MNKLCISLLIVVLFFMPEMEAQTRAKQVSPEVWKLINETKVDSQKDAGAVILLKEDILTVDRNKKTKEIFHIVGKILDQKARLDYAQIQLIFDSYYENYTVDFARSIQADGSVSEVYPDAMMVESLPQIGEGIKYSDRRALTFSLPGLDVGVAFEYQVTIEQKRAIVEGAWFMDHSFNYILRNPNISSMVRFDPVVQSRLSVRIPHGETFQWKMTLDSTSPLMTVCKGYDEYIWEKHNLPEIKMEVGMPSFDKLCSSIEISSLKSWKQIDQWAAKKLFPSAKLTKIISRTAKEVTKGAITNEEKIKRLYYFIQRQVKYVAADLERGGYVPHKSEEVLKNRYGDCKDQTMLLISLLNAVDIKAYPALINPYMSPERITTPVPYFSHVITYIPINGKELWLDPTPGVCPFTEIYVSNQNRHAFIIDGKGGQMLTTPGSTAQENEYIFRFSIFRSESRGNAVVEFGGRGAASDGLKQMFISMSKERSHQYLQSLILDNYKEALIDSILISDVQNPEKSFQAFVYFHQDSIWVGKTQRFAYGGNSNIALDFFINRMEYPHPNARHYDMNLLCPYKISGSEIFPRPNMELSETLLPENDSIETAYFKCERKFDNSFSGALAQWSITQYRTEIPLQDYKSFYKDIDRMKAMMRWSIRFFIPIGKKGMR
jgi:hypothetical protein